MANPGSLPITQANAATSSYEDAQLGQVPPSNDVKQLRRPDLLVNSIIAGGNSVSTGGTTPATLGAIGGHFGFKNVPKCTGEVKGGGSANITVGEFTSRCATYGGTGFEINPGAQAAGTLVRLSMANNLIGTATGDGAPMVMFCPIFLNDAKGSWIPDFVDIEAPNSISVLLRYHASDLVSNSVGSNLQFGLWIMDANDTVV